MSTLGQAMDLFDTNDDDVVKVENSFEELIQRRPAASGVLAFHNGTEDSLLLHVTRTATHGDPISVLGSIDIFCYSRHWMMHIGEQKAVFLNRAVELAAKSAQSANIPVIAVEIGSYCGYSAIRIGMTLPSNGHLYCVEADVKCVEWTRRMVTLAGLSTKITVLHGTIDGSHTLIPTLRETLSTESVRLLFIDHDKRKYLSDLILMEQSGLMAHGCVVVADNVLSFGVPMTEYLSHVRGDSLYVSSELHESFIEYAVATSTTITTASTSSSTASIIGGPANSKERSLIDGVEISIFR